MILAEPPAPTDWVTDMGIMAMMFVSAGAAAFLAARPLLSMVRRRERQYDRVLRGTMLLDISPRVVTIVGLGVMGLVAMIAYFVSESTLITVVAAIGASFIPGAVVNLFRRRRLNKLEDQIVGGVQILSSGVRAGLNLVQAMQMVARDGPSPLRQEFTHLCREYEYGVPLEEAMNNAAVRIGSSDFRLLFSALETHRERGGDLGETLDRIQASIREIQRLEKRVQTLTAQGRATARWLGAMPVVVMLIMYFMVDPEGIKTMFTDDLGKALLGGIVLLNIIGFLWIRKIVTIDI